MKNKNEEIELCNIDDVDNILINIRLISKIDVGNKIITNDKYIDIDTSYFPSLFRWYYEIDRKKNIEYIISIYERAFQLIEKLKKNKNTILLNRLINELKQSITGIFNYKQTYITDKLFQSEIDILIDNIRNKIDEANQ